MWHRISQKIFFSFVTAMIIALSASSLVSNQAFAQGNIPSGRLRRLQPVLGLITDIGQDQFTIQKRAGTTLTFRVDEHTAFRDKDRQRLTYKDLKTNRWVLVIPGRIRKNQDLARMVVLLPETFDPSTLGGARGRVADINSNDSQFALETASGEQIYIQVDGATDYRGQVEGLADLQSGMLARVVGEQISKGQLLAKTVWAGDPLRRFQGRIVSVSPGENAFILKTRHKDREIRILTNEETRFRSRTGLIDDLQDLKVGMPVVVFAEEISDGSYQAQLVLVLSLWWRP